MKVNHLQIEIDGIDKEILRDLMEDARKPILQIAKKVGISGAAIHQRLKKLEQAGVIAGSKFIVNNKVLGYTTVAFVGIYLEKAANNSDSDLFKRYFIKEDADFPAPKSIDYV